MAIREFVSEFVDGLPHDLHYAPHVNYTPSEVDGMDEVDDVDRGEGDDRAVIRTGVLGLLD